MFFYSIVDFYEKAQACRRLTRRDEIVCAQKWKAGDAAERERLLESYIPMVAAHIKRMKKEQQTLGLAVYCMQALEKAVVGLYMEEILPCVKNGLCAAIYTQVSDVEEEINGLLTYDRRLEKLRPDAMLPVAAALQKAIGE